MPSGCSPRAKHVQSGPGWTLPWVGVRPQGEVGWAGQPQEGGAPAG